MAPIARFSVIPALLQTAFLLFFCWSEWFFLNPPAGHNFMGYEWIRRDWWEPMPLLGLLLVPFCLLQASQIIRQLAFRRSAGVWIENGDLHFLNFYGAITFSRVPLADIDKCEVVPPVAFRSASVRLYLKNGKTRNIPGLLLSESAETIARRLPGFLTH